MARRRKEEIGNAEMLKGGSVEQGAWSETEDRRREAGVGWAADALET